MPILVMNRFQKGVAISVWQNSGDSGDSNWTRYTKQCWPLSSMGWSAIRGLHNIDNNTDFWNRHEGETCVLRGTVGTGPEIII